MKSPTIFLAENKLPNKNFYLKYVSKCYLKIGVKHKSFFQKQLEISFEVPS
jgi:hypothetical protein